MIFPFNITWSHLVTWKKWLGTKALSLISITAALLVGVEKYFSKDDLFLENFYLIFIGCVVFLLGMLFFKLCSPIEFKGKFSSITKEVTLSIKMILDYEAFNSRRKMFENCVNRFKSRKSWTYDSEIFNSANLTLNKTAKVSDSTWKSIVPEMESSYFQLRDYDKPYIKTLLTVIFTIGTTLILYPALTNIMNVFLLLLPRLSSIPRASMF